MLYKHAGAIFAIGLLPSPGVSQDNLGQFAAPGEVAIEQIGTENIAEVSSDSNSSLILEQQGNEQAAYVRLSGSANEGNVSQRGDGNSADVMISGSVNAFSVSQTASTPGTSGNLAVLEQIGLSNTAFQTQIGRDNSMTLRQTGDDNFADLLQEGNSNQMELNQFGNENTAELKQFGDRAAPIVITQNGDMGSVSITQTGY